MKFAINVQVKNLEKINEYILDFINYNFNKFYILVAYRK